MLSIFTCGSVDAAWNLPESRFHLCSPYITSFALSVDVKSFAARLRLKIPDFREQRMWTLKKGITYSLY